MMQHLTLFSRKNSAAVPAHPQSFFARFILLCMVLGGTYTTSAQNPFITTWKTDNPGTSNSTSITIPTTGGIYNYEVDWNDDGTYDQSGVTGSVTHDFGAAGTYTIRIRGTFAGIYFNGGGDCQKLLNVGQWGDIAWTSMAFAFYGCSNLQISATDLPNLAGVTNLTEMFRGCTVLNGPANIGNWNTSSITNMNSMFYAANAFNQPIGNWNTANVTNMASMFYATAFDQPIGNWNTGNVTNMASMFDGAPFNRPIGNWNTANVGNMSYMFSFASAFNQPVGNWNVANVTNMSFMFSWAGAFNQPIGTWTLNAAVNLTDMLDNSGVDCDNYTATLIGWNSNPATPNNRTLGALGRQYGTNAVAARTNLTTSKGWTISGDAASGQECPALPAFVTTWKTDNPGTSNSTSITIPTTGGGYNYQVDWNNDGIYDQSGITGDVTHDFGVAGTYTIRIRGAFPRIHFNDGGDRQKLLDVGQWGDLAWTSMSDAFRGCSNLQISATDLPNLGGLTNLSEMFHSCTVLNGPANIGSWNTANVTNMNALFFNAAAFNQAIGSWNTTNVTNMGLLFYGAGTFNQPIGNWSTANATNMFGMFFGTTAFNQPIGNWNTVNVTNMNFMFFSSAFNQPIGNWNTANVTNMSQMFKNAAFNQTIGNWTLNAAVNLTDMLDNSGLDCDNYTATLIGWNSNPATPNNRTLGALGRQYGTNVVAARTNLTTTKGWTISGDAASGVACPPPLPVEWITFSGKWQENRVLLEWQIAGEQNNKGFYVERSTDGLRWMDIGFVAGKGTSNAAQGYVFLDEKPLFPPHGGTQGGLYYRLRQTDFDGKEELSKVVSVNLQNIGTVRVFPNPVSNGELQLFLPENSGEETIVHLFNLAGQLVRSVTLGQGTNLWSISELPTGIYTLQIMNGTVNSFEQIVVEH